MSEGILALISSVTVAVLALLGNIIGNVITSRKTHSLTLANINHEIAQLKADLQAKIDLIKKDINALEAKQDKHNTLIERTYALEETAKVYEEKMKVVNHRIDDLERK